MVVVSHTLEQVAYKQGMNPLKDWTMATDEAHSTKVTIKGLKEGEKYFVKAREDGNRLNY